MKDNEIFIVEYIILPQLIVITTMKVNYISTNKVQTEDIRAPVWDALTKETF